MSIDIFKQSGARLGARAVRPARESITTGRLPGSNLLGTTQATRLPVEKLQNAITNIARYQTEFNAAQEENRIKDKNAKYSVLLTEEARSWAEEQAKKPTFGEESMEEYDKSWEAFKVAKLKEFEINYYKNDPKAWETGEVALKSIFNQIGNIHYANRNKKQNANTITTLEQDKRNFIKTLGELKGQSKIAFKNYVLKVTPSLAARGREVGYNYNLDNFTSTFLNEYYKSHLIDDYTEDGPLGKQVDYDSAIKNLESKEPEEYFADLNKSEKLQLKKFFNTLAKDQREQLKLLEDENNAKLFENYFDKVIDFDPLNPAKYVDPNEIANANFVGKKGIELKKQLLELHRSYYTKQIKTKPSAYNTTLDQVLDGTTTDLTTKNIVIDGKAYSIITNPFISSNDKLQFKNLLDQNIRDDTSSKVLKDAISKFKTQAQNYEVNLRGPMDIARNSIDATNNYVNFLNIKYKEIATKIEQGVSPDELFNPQSNDYIFKDVGNYQPNIKEEQKWLQNQSTGKKVENIYPLPTKEAIELLKENNDKYKTLFIDMFGLEAYNKHSK